MSRALLAVILVDLVVSSSVVFCSTVISDNVTFAAEYLQQYGYLSERKNEQISIANNTIFTHAISLFQEYYNLPITGILTVETVTLMMQPRCGVQDINPKEMFTHNSKWPKTHLTWNFQLPSVKDLLLATRAFEYWTNVSSLTFSRQIINPDILISYKTGFHRFSDARYGDSTVCLSSFDGRGNILAHAYGPSEAINHVAEIHVDKAEPWYIELSKNPPETTSLLPTLIHEIGHTVGLHHSPHRDAIMFAYTSSTTYPPKLTIDDIQSIQNLYGPNTNNNIAPIIAPPPPPPITTSLVDDSATTTMTTRTTTTMRTTRATVKKDAYPDICSLKNIDVLIVLNRKLFITHGRYLWTVNLNGKIADPPLLLTNYMPFLPVNFTRFIGAYQRSSGELVLFTDTYIYMIQYPSVTLVSGWPKTYRDIGIRDKTKINGILSTYTGRSFVLYNDRVAAEMDDCNTVVRKYEDLYTVFPGVPPKIRMTFRYIDGNLFFVGKHRYVRFNEFENTVTSGGNFDLSLVKIVCPREGLMRNLRDLLARLITLGDTHDYFDVNNTDDDEIW